jgi:hypothetical protein
LKQPQAIICKQDGGGINDICYKPNVGDVIILKQPQAIICKQKMAAGLMTFAVNLTLTMLLF